MLQFWWRLALACARPDLWLSLSSCGTLFSVVPFHWNDFTSLYYLGMWTAPMTGLYHKPTGFGTIRYSTKRTGNDLVTWQASMPDSNSSLQGCLRISLLKYGNIQLIICAMLVSYDVHIAIYIYNILVHSYVHIYDTVADEIKYSTHLTMWNGE